MERFGSVLSIVRKLHSIAERSGLTKLFTNEFRQAVGGAFRCDLSDWCRRFVISANFLAKMRLKCTEMTRKVARMTKNFDTSRKIG